MESDMPAASRGTAHALQWGHDLSVMERTISVAGSRVQVRLQWGHDLSVMESPDGRAARAKRFIASMGP